MISYRFYFGRPIWDAFKEAILLHFHCAQLARNSSDSSSDKLEPRLRSFGTNIKI